MQIVVRFKAKGPGRGWWGPEHGGTHVARRGTPRRESETVAARIVKKDPTVVGRANETMSYYAERLGMSQKEFEQQAVAGMKKIIGNNPVAIRTPLIAAQDIAQEGRFKNQHEVGTSRGIFNPEGRAKVEESAFNLPGKAPGDHPIYGHVSNSLTSKIGLDQYGPVEWQLKDSVKDRTTITVGDSLGGLGSHVIPSPIRSPSALSGGYKVDDLVRGQYRLIEFMETQVHGGITLDDVGKVRIHVSYAGDIPRYDPQVIPIYRASKGRFGIEFMTSGGEVIPFDAEGL